MLKYLRFLRDSTRSALNSQFGQPLRVVAKSRCCQLSTANTIFMQICQQVIKSRNAMVCIHHKSSFWHNLWSTVSSIGSWRENCTWRHCGCQNYWNWTNTIRTGMPTSKQYYTLPKNLPRTQQNRHQMPRGGQQPSISIALGQHSWRLSLDLICSTKLSNASV